MIYIVMGGQAGSEGKGEFVAYLANKLNRKGNLGAVVRTGGPNAGHTMTVPVGDGHWSDCTTHNEPASPNEPCNCGGIEPKKYKMRQIPCAWHLTPKVPLIIAHGSLIDLNVLESELKVVVDALGSGVNDLPTITIDKHAVVIQLHHKLEETRLRTKIGSTGEGIGAARADHVMRRDVLADDMKGLFPSNTYRNLFTDADTATVLNWLVGDGKDIVIESTQGFDLSLNLSGHYPRTTSRDITPSQILSDCGLSSRVDHRVIAVVRTYPIRVAGNSGPMARETDWETLKEESGGYIAKPETTTVTGNVRRIGYYDDAQIRRMGKICRPDFIALTFLDYLDPRCAGLQGQDLNNHLKWSNDIDATDIEGEGMDSVQGDPKVKQLIQFIDKVETDSGARIGWISTGPGVITSFGSPGPEGSVVWGFTPDITAESMEAQRS